MSGAIEAVPSAMDKAPDAVTRRLRPKDAATIILLDCTYGEPRFLMGRRGHGHAFMPGLYVFPGGRRDRRDHALPFSRDLHPLVARRLLCETMAKAKPSSARALALAALRELKEETGLVVGDPPDLSHLRYVARAVTPPGNVRRFDTRFFLLPTDEADISPSSLVDTDELQDLRWLSFSELSSIEVPRITAAVMHDVKSMFVPGSPIPYGLPVPYYFMRHGRFLRTQI
ncbi:NUDIX hydrolase [Rhizobium halophilum]|uniref:NUDIX hydrolase n=1 Tax=Rhizobium halophilum TaxID=2846852 RepID=UPI00293F5EF3|nr:NUDIX hydrolase [Rhizobium halophilum]